MSEEAKNGLVLTDFGSEAIDKAKLLLSDINGGLRRAVNNSMIRTATAVRTETSKAVRESYDISVSALNTYKNVKTYYKMGDSVFYAYIHYRSIGGIPLFRFNGVTPKYPKQDTSKTTAAIIAGYGHKAKWRMIHPSVEASAHVLKSTSPKKLGDAFVATMKSGHTGIFKRTGGVTGGVYGGSDEIRELMGPNIAQMLGNKNVQDNIAKKAEKVFEDRMEHETLRILNGMR